MLMARRPPLSPEQLPDWPVGDPAAPLAPGVVRVWLWSLDGPCPDCDERWLSVDERDRADRFHFGEDRQHFVAARCGLRRLLAAATGRSPAEVAFRYHGLGKPALEHDGATVRFNLSHSAGVALAAVSADADVGADIEAVRPTRWADGIAERYFSPTEVAGLRGEPVDRQDQAFFRFWTNKEAVVKLIGTGLGFPLPAFTTPLDAPTGAEVTLPKDNPLALSRCWVRPLPTGEHLRGAVATPGSVERVECFRL
ncbi:4'-phosphopantetheinyl transferase psf-1 [Posidoniimonas polymericola]|uniref:4'-phosphopantetheinyl transferase psf-1 n=2 Tax=Posidoniimonas polymericola TaxID=2528002 RepID=A0A5C5ZD65_9BACT|nr:4'-phosphopantetheinyl transferase psf-1 [Posidoniimonas polymericola]